VRQRLNHGTRRRRAVARARYTTGGRGSRSSTRSASLRLHPGPSVTKKAVAAIVRPPASPAAGCCHSGSGERVLPATAAATTARAVTIRSMVFSHVSRTRGRASIFLPAGSRSDARSRSELIGLDESELQYVRERVGCTNTISLQILDFTTGAFVHATPSAELDASPGFGSSAECPTRKRGFLGPAGQSDPTVNLSVFRRHPCGASALGSARKSG
jgi:hypothetical protein